MQSKTSTSQHVKLASLIAIIIIITEHIAERICTLLHTYCQYCARIAPTQDGCSSRDRLALLIRNFHRNRGGVATTREFMSTVVVLRLR
jgi:hypothetical protein